MSGKSLALELAGARGFIYSIYSRSKNDNIAFFLQFKTLLIKVVSGVNNFIIMQFVSFCMEV